MAETASGTPNKPPRGRARPERRVRAGVAAPAYVKRAIPFYDFLDEEQLLRIENQADWLIQEIGIEFRDDPVALDIWRMAGANFVPNAAGWLAGGLCTGYEKPVIDADRLGAYQVMLLGMATDDNALGRHACGDVEPAGHFLGSAHTLANYQTAYYDAVKSDSISCEQWEERGSKGTATRAFEQWNRLLEVYEAPEIDPGVDEALRDHVARKKAGVEDAWY